MKIKETLKKLLTNKYVLNIVCIITFLNLIGRIMLNDIHSIVYFILIALLVSFFSKNMIIILGIPLILTSVKIYKVEGMENASDKEGTHEKEDLQKKVDEINKNAPPKNDFPITSTIPTPSPDATPPDEPFEVGRSKNKGSKYNVDYASTVEGAYDELNKIIGSDGMKNLTSDTQNLMKQQNQLAESMKTLAPMIQGMTPMLEQAKQMMSTMEGSGLGNIAELAKKFTSSMK